VFFSLKSLILYVVHQLWSICVTNDHEYVQRCVHNLDLSSFMTYHRVCNITGVTCGAATAYTSGAPKSTPGF